MRLYRFPTGETRLSLCWLREDRPGHLAAAFVEAASTETLRPSLERLVPGVPREVISRLTDRILEITHPGQAVEFHLPYIDRFNWSRHGQILSQTRFRLHGATMLPADCASPAAVNRYYARLLAACAFEPCPTATIQAPPDSLPASLFAAWRQLPSERRAAYFPVLAPATGALQRALRHIVENALFADLDLFRRPDIACPLLAYIASAPCPGTPRADFTYDLMRSRWLLSAFHTAFHRLEGLLRTLHAAIDAAGRDDLRGLYGTVTAREILRAIRQSRMSIRPVFAAEQHIIDGFVLLGAQIRDAAKARTLARRTVDFVDRLAVRLHRFKVGELKTQIPHLLVEATRGVALGASRVNRLAA